MVQGRGVKRGQLQCAENKYAESRSRGNSTARTISGAEFAWRGFQIARKIFFDTFGLGSPNFFLDLYFARGACPNDYLGAILSFGHAPRAKYKSRKKLSDPNPNVSKKFFRAI